MSIRTPHYNSITIPNGGCSNAFASGWTCSPVDADSFKVQHSPGIRISSSWGNVSDQVEIRKPEFIPTPEWVERIDGHNTECFDMDGFDCGVVVACYKPDHTLGVGFAKAFIFDRKTGKPFPQMKGLWDETKNRLDSNGLDIMFRAIHPECKIDDDGRLTGPFGMPDVHSILGVVQEMAIIWNEWRDFPKVEEYSMVRRLIDAWRDIAVMKHETEGKGITREIEEYRAEIKESQEKIAKLEKELNEIYEKAADAMNLLEENGVKVDMDGIKAEKDYDGTVEGYADGLIINHAYPGQGIMIEPPPSGTLMSTLPPSAFQLSNEELEEFQKEWGNYSSDLTVYNGTGISSAHAASNAINSGCTSLSCAS